MINTLPGTTSANHDCMESDITLQATMLSGLADGFLDFLFLFLMSMHTNDVPSFVTMRDTPFPLPSTYCIWFTYQLLRVNPSFSCF